MADAGPDDALLRLLRAAEDAVIAAAAGRQDDVRRVVAEVRRAAAEARDAGRVDAGALERWQDDVEDALAARGFGAVDLGPWWAASPGPDGGSPAPDADPAAAPWWWAVPAVRSPMPCGTEGHIAVWWGGELEVAGLDRESEEVLAALGGTSCRCAETHEAWAASSGDVRLLVSAARSTADPCRVGLDALAAAEALRLPAIRAWERHRARSGMDDPADPALAAWWGRVRRLLLLTLPAPLQQRLVAGIADGAARRWSMLSAEGRSILTAATAARVVPVLRASLQDAGVGGDSGAGDLRVEVVLTPAGAPAVAVERSGEHLGIRLEVDAAWLATVWGRGLVAHGGDLCLAVTGVTESSVAGGTSVRWRVAGGNTRVEPQVVQWENERPPTGEPPTQE